MAEALFHAPKTTLRIQQCFEYVYRTQSYQYNILALAANLSAFPCRSKIGISRAGGSRSRTGASAFASGHAGAGMGGVRVFCNGVNVTPQSLLNSSARTARAAAGRQPSGDAHSKRYSATGGGGVAPRKKSSLSVDAQSGTVAAAATAAVRAEGGSGGGKPPTRRKRDGPAEEGRLTEEDLSVPITIVLSETPTTMLLEIRGSAVATDLRDFGR